MVLPRNYCCGSCLVFFRKFYIYSVLRTNHYKVLGLTPSATQSQIKSAYYELSKKHHPDKNQGSEKSARIFRNITAAYEVLGNEKLRKKYDETHRFNVNNDFSNFDASQRADYNDDVERMYYERRQRQFRRRYYGKTPFYDFDAWYRAHYGRNFHDNDPVKNSYSDFEKWNKSQYRRNQGFEYKGGMYKDQRAAAEELKKQEAFIFKMEQGFIIFFYFTLFLTILFKI